MVLLIAKMVVVKQYNVSLAVGFMIYRLQVLFRALFF